MRFPRPYLELIVVIGLLLIGIFLPTLWLSGPTLYGVQGLFVVLITLCFRLLTLKRLANATTVFIRELNKMTDDPHVSAVPLPTEKIKIKDTFQVPEFMRKSLEQYTRAHLDMHSLLDRSKRLNDRLEFYARITNAIFEYDDFTELLNFILKETVTLIPNATHGSIMSIDEDGYCQFIAVCGFKLDSLQKIHLHYQDAYLYKMTNGKGDVPVIVNDTQAIIAETSNESEISDYEDAGVTVTKAAMSAPIQVGGKSFGMLNIDSTHKDAFQDHDLAIISYLTTQMSIVLENRLLYEKTIELSRFDGLTKLYNRTYFEEVYEEFHQECLTHKTPYSVCLIDLNNLKTINDQYGHHTGDFYLSSFAAELASFEKRDFFVARYGGDEFILILKGTRISDANLMMDRFSRQINGKELSLQGYKLSFSFSYGLSEFPYESLRSNELIRIADQRMYQFKQAYKNSSKPIS